MKLLSGLLLLLLASDLVAQSLPWPPAKRLHIRPDQLFDVTQARKHPANLFDGDTTTPAFMDWWHGFILKDAGGQTIWIVLDSFINHPKIEVFNTQWSSGGLVEFQFYYDWTDTSRKSPVYTVTLPSAAWKWVDTLQTRAWRDSARLIRLRIASEGSNNFMEARIYAHTLGPAPSIAPPPAPEPPDEGKYFMGYGKLFPDSLLDDAGYSQRAQNDMGYIDTMRETTGKDLVFNRFSNSVVLSYIPAKRKGIKIYPYFAGPREGFKYPPHYNNDSKDMPFGADSTSEAAWQTVYHTYYALAAKFGYNTEASLQGYTWRNTVPGTGLGLIEEIEAGNEDDARWAGPLRFHSPLVKLMKLRSAYAGIKAADPNMKVISGALTGIDTSYLKALYFVNLLRFQTKSVPFDVIALNEYATNAGGQHSGTADGITPEKFRLYEKLRAAAHVRDRYYPGKPIYLTEFGYDVHDGSNYDVPVINGQTREQTKAYWMLRAMEITAAARISRFYMYTQRSLGGGDFSTTGYSYDTLLKNPGRELPASLHPFMSEQVLQHGGWTSLPRDLYWHMTMRARVLENYHAWPTILRKGDSTGIWVLKYGHRTHADSVVYAVWMGTDKNASVKNYVLPLPRFRSATIVRAAWGKKEGDRQAAQKSGKGVLLPVVDEAVTYVMVKE